MVNSIYNGYRMEDVWLANNPPAPKMTPADRRGWRAPRRGEMR
jgi:hypothetical protein